MTREEAKVMEPIMKAFIEGKTIECRTKTWEVNKGWRYSTNWKKIEQLIFSDTYEYRIKPEQKYRPFNNKEECWNEMLKHQPFGWTIDKYNNFAHIDLVYNCDPENGYGVRLRQNPVNYNFEGMFQEYKFADGTPFGIKYEE